MSCPLKGSRQEFLQKYDLSDLIRSVPKWSRCGGSLDATVCWMRRFSRWLLILRILIRSFLIMKHPKRSPYSDHPGISAFLNRSIQNLGAKSTLRMTAFLMFWSVCQSRKRLCKSYKRGWRCSLNSLREPWFNSVESLHSMPHSTAVWSSNFDFKGWLEKLRL